MPTILPPRLRKPSADPRNYRFYVLHDILNSQTPKLQKELAVARRTRRPRRMVVLVLFGRYQNAAKKHHMFKSLYFRSPWSGSNEFGLIERAFAWVLRATMFLIGGRFLWAAEVFLRTQSFCCHCSHLKPPGDDAKPSAGRYKCIFKAIGTNVIQRAQSLREDLAVA